MTNNKACDQVMSLALVKMTTATHATCGGPMTAHYGMDCFGTLYAPKVDA
jgi:hypothetical protein